MFKFLKNYFKQPERKQYNLLCQNNITVYFDGERWYDCIVNSYAAGLNNTEPILVEGTVWDTRKFKNFKDSKNVSEVIDKLSYVDSEFIYKDLVEEFIKNNVVKLRRGFITIDRFIPFTKMWYNCVTKENETYVMWLVNDEDFTFSMLLNNLDKNSILLNKVKDHLLEHPPITEKETEHHE